MSPLLNAKHATLYDMDCIRLTEIQYIKEAADTVTLIFREAPPEDFPQKFFLMPNDSAYDYRAFIFTLSEDIHLCPPAAPEESSRYFARAVTNDIPEQRKNYRVYVTIPISVLPEGGKRELPVTVKDIGTGGFLFISRERFEAGTLLTTMFTHTRTPVCVTARIQKLRPVRQEGFHGYGCQFVNIPPGVETLVRNYVFHIEALQAKAKKEKKNAK